MLDRATTALAVAGGAFLTRALDPLDRIGSFPEAELARVRRGRSSALFDTYPGLARRLPWRPLADLPTPIEPLPPAPGAPNVRLFVKRDDLASLAYGGNKVRKLEHLLAEAELAGARTLVTLGGIGSNHALATATHGRALGYAVHLVLYDQPVTPFVLRNLGGFVANGAVIHYSGGTAHALLDAGRLHARLRKTGERPYFIMIGGTSTLGSIGHVTAALELASQVASGILPEPDLLFLPLGTTGTAAGLVVGLKLAGLRTRVASVRVADPTSANRLVLRQMAQRVADFLHRSDPAVPRLDIHRNDFDLVTTHLGRGYGHPTAAGEAAREWAAARLQLEPTYGAKTLAACFEACRSAPPGSSVLFWNTFNSAPVTVSPDRSTLPPNLLRKIN